LSQESSIHWGTGNGEMSKKNGFRKTRNCLFTGGGTLSNSGHRKKDCRKITRTTRSCGSRDKLKCVSMGASLKKGSRKGKNKKLWEISPQNMGAVRGCLVSEKTEGGVHENQVKGHLGKKGEKAERAHRAREGTWRPKKNIMRCQLGRPGWCWNEKGKKNGC